MTLKEFYQGMEPHLYRFAYAVTRPWARGYKNRRGYEDFSHAYVNIDVEAARLDPYIYGHIISFSRLVRWAVFGLVLYAVH